MRESMQVVRSVYYTKIRTIHITGASRFSPRRISSGCARKLSLAMILDGDCVGSQAEGRTKKAPVLDLNQLGEAGRCCHAPDFDGKFVRGVGGNLAPSRSLADGCSLNFPRVLISRTRSSWWASASSKHGMRFSIGTR